MAWVSPLDHEPARDFLAGLAAVGHSELASLDEAARAQAFWIAQATDLRLVQDVLEQTGRSLVKGEPWGDFQEGLLQRLTNDWQGRVPNPPRRLELIVRNLGMRSYNTGRYRQMMTDGVRAARPFGLFDAIIDGRETPICKANNGLLLPLDDPAWQTRWPGLHHKCRSIVRSLSQSEASRRGGVTPPAERPGPEGTPAEGFGAAPGSRGEWEGMRIRPADYDPNAWEVAQTKGLTEVPEIPPRPLPPPQPWEDPNSGMTARERDWHRRAWSPETPVWLREAIGRRGPLARIRHRRSSLDSGYDWSEDAMTIGLGPGGAVDRGRVVGAFRHEYGHALDFGTSRQSIMQVSSRPPFIAAAEQDRERLSKRLGRRSKRRDKLDLEAAELRDLEAAARATEIGKVMKRAGLDEGRVRALLSRESIAGSNLTEGEIDALVWRFGRAWAANDVQALVHLLDHPLGKMRHTYQLKDLNPVLDRILEGGVLQQRLDDWGSFYNAEVSAGGSFSDLVDALSHGRLGGSTRHEAAYYRQLPVGLRYAEIFANIVDILGSGTMGRELVEKVTPTTLADLASPLGRGP